MSRRERDIRLANLRLIEAEIRHYPETLKELEKLETEIASPGAVPDSIVKPIRIGYGYNDPTPAKAFRIMTSQELCELRRRAGAIEYMLRIVRLMPERYRLLELTYWSNRKYTVREICEKLNICPGAYRRWKNQALETVAEQLGWKI